MTKGDVLYAYIMKPQGRKTAVIKSLREEEKVCSVESLGRGALSFAQHSGVLVVDLPDGRDEEYPNVLKIRFEK